MKGTIQAIYDADKYFHAFDVPVCVVGDTIGCGIITATSKTDSDTVYFTRNGFIVKKLALVEIFENLYPIVGFVPDQHSSVLFMDWHIPIFEFPNLLSNH